MNIQDFLDSQPYSESTKATYRYVLKDLATLPVENWTASNLLGFIKRENWGNSMRYVALNACKSYIRWRWGSGHPALSACLKRVKPKPQRVLTIEKIIELLALFDTYTPKGARDQCIAAIAIDTGLRLSELARIKLADMDLEHRTILVTIKGGQWEYAVYSRDTAQILHRWLSYRKPADGVGTLFVALSKNKNNGRPLTANGIKCLFKEWSKRLGYRISPHDCRRTFATVSTIMGAPSRVVQVAGRWSNIEMVEHYTRSVEAHAIEPYLPIHHALKEKVKP